MSVDTKNLDWAARANMLRPIREEQLGAKTDAKSLKPGDRVSVTTALGRTVATGAVVSVDEAGNVLAKLDTAGVDQSQNFSPDIYQFYVLPPETEANLSEGGAMISDPALAADTGPEPAKPDETPPSQPVQIILPFVNYDLRWAVTIWDDIGHYGYDRGMTRHAVPELAKQTIRSMLLDKKIITTNDALTPEWVQAATTSPTGQTQAG